MDVLEEFKLHLQNKGLSIVSIKNYSTDVARFIRWYEKQYAKRFDPRLVGYEDIQQYKKTTQDYSAESSFDRYISSLRAYFFYLYKAKLIRNNIFEAVNNKVLESDAWHVNAFKDYLYVYGAAPLTIKNYVNDLLYFRSYIEATVGNKSFESDYFSYDTIQAFATHLYKHAPGTINRRISSIRKYISFLLDQGYFTDDLNYPDWQLDISNDNLLQRLYKNRSYIYYFSVLVGLGFLVNQGVKSALFNSSIQQPLTHSDSLSQNSLTPSSYLKLWNDLQKLSTSNSYILSLILEKKDPQEVFDQEISSQDIVIVVSSEFASIDAYKSSSYVVIEDTQTPSLPPQGPINEAEVMYTKVSVNFLTRSVDTMNACVLFSCAEIAKIASIYKPIFNLPPLEGENTSLYLTKEEDTYRSLVHILSESNKKNVKVAISKPINNSLPINLIVVQ